MPCVRRRYRHTWEAHPPLPQGKKKDAVAYINSNCGAPSGRNEIVQALMDQPGITVDSFGRCLNNQEERLAAGAGKKYDTFREYAPRCCSVSSAGMLAVAVR